MFGRSSHAHVYFGAAVVVCGMLVYRTALGSHGLATDDTHIHLRIARNWASGAGPVFNVGERVEASSSPAWLALLTLGFCAGLSPLAMLTALEILCAAWIGAATAWLAGLCGGRMAGFIGPLLIGVLPSYGVWIGSGMETPMAIAVLATVVATAMTVRRARGAIGVGLLSALLVLVRQEALAVVPALVWLATRGMEPRLRLRAAGLCLLACGLPLLLLLLARHAYYGAWVPNTYVAKVAGETLSDRAQGIVYVAKFVAVHIVLFAFAGLALLKRETRRVGVAVVLVVYLLAVMWTGGDHFYYSRLAVPTLPLLTTLAATAGVSLTGPWRVGATAMAAAQLAWAILIGGNMSYAKVALLHAGYAEDIGTSLAGLPEGWVATISIGGVGFTSDRPILDLVGLTDPVIARSPRIPGAKNGHNHGDVNYVLGRRPAFVIPIVWVNDKPTDDAEEKRQFTGNYQSLAAAAQLVLDPRFREQYRPFDWIVGTSGHVRIWGRRDLPWGPSADPTR